MRLSSPVLVSEICSLLKCEVLSGKVEEIAGMNEIHKVVEGDLSFVDHVKYYRKVLESPASVVLINTKDIEALDGTTLIYSEDPFRDYNKLVKHFCPFEKWTEPISKKAIVGKGTILQPNVVLGNDVVIGDNCLIYPNVVLYDGTRVGNNVIIHANTVIGGDAFYFKQREDKHDKLLSCGRVIIDDNVEIGASCTIDKGVSGDTIIGEGTKLDNMVHVGHGVTIGRMCLIAAQVGIAGKTRIGNNVKLWGQVGVSKDLDIGDGVEVLAQSGVPKSLPSGKRYFGSPVAEARNKMKEIALVRRIPALLDRMKKLEGDNKDDESKK